MRGKIDMSQLKKFVIDQTLMIRKAFLAADSSSIYPKVVCLLLFVVVVIKLETAC